MKNLKYNLQLKEISNILKILCKFLNKMLNVFGTFVKCMLDYIPILIIIGRHLEFSELLFLD